MCKRIWLLLVILEDKNLHPRLSVMSLDMRKRLWRECYLTFDKHLLGILSENSEFVGLYIKNANF
jgi:hypothetical protein